MLFVEIGAFEVLHRKLAWPWIAIDPGGERLAFVASPTEIATRVLIDKSRLAAGPSFTLPGDLTLPGKAPAPTGHRGAEVGLHAFALDVAGARLAVTGMVGGESVLETIDADGTRLRSSLVTLGLTGEDFVAHAVSFDRSGARLWLSAETETETALILVEASTHRVFGVLKSPGFPLPSFHTLHVHPQDDAVLLLAACGQDGTFARVAGWAHGAPVPIATKLDRGGASAGFVGFSIDGARVHLAESDELRTHAWPGLEELSAAPFKGEFVSSYAGVVMDHRIFVDGEDEDGGEDAVAQFDRSAIVGARLKPPFPTGMWVGRLGADAVVTVAAEGDPAQAAVVRFPVPKN